MPLCRSGPLGACVNGSAELNRSELLLTEDILSEARFVRRVTLKRILGFCFPKIGQRGF
jgi:hypothetical protein